MPALANILDYLGKLIPEVATDKVDGAILPNCLGFSFN